MRTSRYEEQIISVLKKEKIDFIREKNYTDLRKGKYRFDFYFPKNNCLVEIQGEQHYVYVARFYKCRSDFLSARERDRRKISYALANKIKLFIIPYWELPKITSGADLFQQKYLAINRWKNDDDWREYNR